MHLRAMSWKCERVREPLCLPFRCGDAAAAVKEAEQMAAIQQVHEEHASGKRVIFERAANKILLN